MLTAERPNSILQVEVCADEGRKMLGLSILPQFLFIETIPVLAI